MLKITQRLQYALVALTLPVITACNYSGTEWVGNPGDYSPPATEQGAELSTESPSSQADQNDVRLASEQPTDPPYEIWTRSDDDGDEEGPCLGQFYDLYSDLYAQAAQYNSPNSVHECKKVEVVTSDGTTVFKAQLKGPCRLEVEQKLPGQDEVDKTFDLCG